MTHSCKPHLDSVPDAVCCFCNDKRPLVFWLAIDKRDVSAKKVKLVRKGFVQSQMVRRKLTPVHNAAQCGNSELASMRWYASRVDGMKGDGNVTFQNIEGRVKEIAISSIGKDFTFIQGILVQGILLRR